VQLKEEASREEETPKLCVFTAMIRDTESVNAANGKKRRVRKRRKLISKIVIVTVMLAVLLQQ
jgi:hypothetical protein